jgi:hypothetical protein
VSTTVKLYPEKQTYVVEGYPDTNFTGYPLNQRLLIGDDNYGTTGSNPTHTVCNTWLGFDLSSIPWGSYLVSAHLHMCAYYLAFSASGYDTDCYFDLNESLDNTWNQYFLCWNNVPNVVEVSSTSFGINTSATYSIKVYPSIDLYGNVNSHLGGKVSWRITAQDGTAVVALFSSSNYSQSQLYPYLELVYDPVIAPIDKSVGDNIHISDAISKIVMLNPIGKNPIDNIYTSDSISHKKITVGFPPEMTLTGVD